MRIELHLILWVSALLFGAYAIFNGYGNAQPVPYLQAESMELDRQKTSDVAGIETVQKSGQLDPELRIESPGARDIFTSQGVEFSAPPVEAVTVSAMQPELVLKGVVRSGAYLRIIVSRAGSDAYIALAVGEKFEQFEVRAIEDDGAILRNSSTGEELLLTLRGLGETP